MSRTRLHTLVPLVAVVVLSVALAATAFAGTQAQSAAKLERFLIIAPHTPESCLKALDDMEAYSPALLTKTDWGCMAGDHTGYVVVEAASEQAARDLLPPSARAAARVVKLNKFTEEQIRSFHQKM